MNIFKKIRDMKAQSYDWKKSGKIIGIVPTMGCLHEGHLSLIRESVKDCDKTVVTIFVNPIQFAPGEDFNSYPRVFERDCELCEKERVDAVFYPADSEMYPEGFQTKVSVKELQKHLCGLSRPGHFDGVTTVVLKLFNIVMPHKAYFGQKDYQQLQIIKRMVGDLNLDVEIIEMPIVREKDGLAMSSRNRYLSDEERKKALIVPRIIDEAEKLLRKGDKKIKEIKKYLYSMAEDVEGAKVDYISFSDPETLDDIAEIQNHVLVAVAIKIGSARLIDNRVIHLTKE
ncbi:MAG: pantoate--beta-alanine ligase [Candidatus Schekmanbacteria bacterium]|nr:MAG: pantoate--beta-alanine ligase [Candidatus Schekmanbacteria bacterium]